MNMKAFYSLSYGLFIVSSNADGKQNGCVSNTFIQVTSAPVKASITLNKDNLTADYIKRSGVFTVTVMSEDVSMDVIGAFGFHSGKTTDKFAGRAAKTDALGNKYVEDDMVARFAVRVTEVTDVGTHLTFTGEVEEAEIISDKKPMTYNYYQTVKKGTTPKNASSYNPAVAAGTGGTEKADAPKADAGGGDAKSVAKKRKWQCMMCGYIYEGDELPEGYKCPLCGAPRECFEELK